MNNKVRELYYKIHGHDDKLLPCPFCGSPAELWEYSPSDGVSNKVAMCSNNGNEDTEPQVIECPLYMSTPGFYKATKREAINEWNKRKQ